MKGSPEIVEYPEERNGGVRARSRTPQVSRGPIYWLPNEVLILIFERDAHHQRERNANLIRVCRLWRVLVMSSPTLWNHIILRLRYFKDFWTAWYYAESCLKLSGTTSLSLLIDASFFSTKSDDEQLTYEKGVPVTVNKEFSRFQEVLLELENELQFWKRFELAMVATLAILRGDDNETIPRWRSCRLRFWDNDGLPEVCSRVWNDIIDMTSRSVTLECMGLLIDERRDFNLFRFPTGTALKSFAINMNTIFPLNLTSFSTLEHLFLSGNRPSISFLTLASRKFQSLRSLQLHFGIKSGLLLSESMTRADPPSLEVLTLAGDGVYKALPTLQIEAPKLTHYYAQGPLSHLYTPSPVLSTITELLCIPIRERPINITRLTSLMELMPSLKRVYVPDSLGKHGALELFTRRTSPSPIFVKGIAEWPYYIPERLP